MKITTEDRVSERRKCFVIEIEPKDLVGVGLGLVEQIENTTDVAEAFALLSKLIKQGGDKS